MSAETWPPGVAIPTVDRRAVAFTALVGVLFDRALASGVITVTGAVLVLVAGAGLVLSRRLETTQSRVCAAAAPVFGLFLAVRASDWLIPLDILVAAGLLVLAATLARGGDLFDIPLGGLLMRGATAVLRGLSVPLSWIGWMSWARTRWAVGERAERAVAALRGLAIAVPVMLVLIALLASGDAVFRSLLDNPVSESWLLHGVVVSIGAYGAAGLLHATGQPPRAVVDRRWLGPIEAGVVLGGLVAVYAVFAVAQLVAISSSGRAVLDTAGLTYAEYARTGFFQLVAAAGITLVTLLVVRSGVTEVSRRLVVLAELGVALTLVAVVVSLRRLDLYEDAYGLTMLRLYVTVFAWLLAALLALLGVWAAGMGRRDWWTGAALVTGLAVLLGLNVANPEAFVARHNLARARTGAEVDAAYLASLSTDALPALERALATLPTAVADEVRAAVCSAYGATSGGWPSWNRSLREAERVRDRLGCPAHPQLSAQPAPAYG